ncbi:MAG: hypothetical protein RL885_09225 [Planctomycetota bacterium]
MLRAITWILVFGGMFLFWGPSEASAQGQLDQGCLYYTSANYNASAGRLRVISRGSGQFFVVAGFERGQTWINNVGLIPLTGQFFVLGTGSSPSCQNNVSDFQIGGPHGIRGYVTTVWFGTNGRLITPVTPADI